MATDLAKMGSDMRRRMGRMEAAVKRSKRDIVRAGAVEAKKAHQEVIRRHTGGDSRMSGVGKRGRKVGARFDEWKADAITVRATGPLHLLERDTEPHRIPKVRGRRARRRYVVLGAGPDGVRAWAEHPGTRGKGTWAKGQKRAIPRARLHISSESRRVLREAMRT